MLTLATKGGGALAICDHFDQPCDQSAVCSTVYGLFTNQPSSYGVSAVTAAFKEQTLTRDVANARDALNVTLLTQVTHVTA